MSDPEQDQWNARRRKTPSKVVYQEDGTTVTEHYDAKSFLAWCEREGIAGLSAEDLGVDAWK